MDSLNLKKVLVVDKKVDVEETYRPKEIVHKGGVNKSMFIYNADSYSDQMIVFNNIVPPSLNTVVERSLRLRYTLTVTCQYQTAAAAQRSCMLAVDGTAAHTPIINAGLANVVLRALPLQSAATSIEARINGTPSMMACDDLTCLYPHLFTQDELQRYSAEFPCQKDNKALYGAVAVNSGSNRSPFAEYSQNPYVPSRASYLATRTATAAAGNNTIDTYTVEVTEQLLVSPFLYGADMDDTGLSNVNNLTLNIRIADINRCLSCVIPNANNVVTVTIANFKPALLVQYITPDPIIAAKMPPELVFDYEQYQPFNTPLAPDWNYDTPVANGEANSIRISSIPSRFYIYARPRKGWSNANNPNNTLTDTFLRITGLNIQYNNRIGVLSTFTEKDIYKMSVANGLQDSFYDWAYGTGSIAIVDVSKDICLESDEDTGQSNRYSTLQVRATFSASPLAAAGNAAQIPYDMYIVVVQTGKAVITKSSCEFILAGVSASEVLALSANPSEKADDLEVQQVHGAGFGRSARRLLSNGISLARTTKGFLDNNPELVSAASSLANQFDIPNRVQNYLSGGSVAGGKLAKHRRAL